MKTSIIKIGNSKGIRIPKLMLEQCGFKEEVCLEVRNQKLVIRSVSKPRQNWDEAFQQMAATKEDILLEMPSSDWDRDEWHW